MFHEAIAADPEFVRRFDTDAQAVAALEHPHIAPVYDYWREPGRAYVVSRYLRGGSLRAIEERASRSTETGPYASSSDLSGAHVRPPPGARAPSVRPTSSSTRRAPPRRLVGSGPAPIPRRTCGSSPASPAACCRRKPPSRSLPSRPRLRPTHRRRRPSPAPAARLSSPRRSPLLRALKRNPFKGLGRSQRPTPATSSGARAHSLVAADRGGARSSSWPLSARAGAGSHPRGPGSRARDGALGGRRIPSSPRCSPESTPSTSWRPLCFGSRYIRCHGSASGSIRDLGTARGRGSRGARRGGGRGRRRSVRRGVHAHHRRAGAGTLPGVASRRRRRPRVGFA